MKMRSMLDRVRMIPRAGVPPRVIRLSNLENVWKQGMKYGSLSPVTVGEGLVLHVESPFFWFTIVEVTQDDAHSVGIRRPMRIDETQPCTKLSLGKLRFEVDVDNDETLSPRLYFHNMVTALASNHVCHKGIHRQKILVNANERFGLEKPDPTRPLVFQVIHEDLHQGEDHRYPDLQDPAVLEVVEEHLASNGNA